MSGKIRDGAREGDRKGGRKGCSVGALVWSRRELPHAEQPLCWCLCANQLRQMHASSPMLMTRSVSALGLLRQNQHPSTGLPGSGKGGRPAVAASMYRGLFMRGMLFRPHARSTAPSDSNCMCAQPFNLPTLTAQLLKKKTSRGTYSCRAHSFQKGPDHRLKPALSLGCATNTPSTRLLVGPLLALGHSNLAHS